MSSRICRYVGRHHWGMLATFIALGGTAYASAELPANSVGTKQLKGGAVTLSKIRVVARRSLGRPTGRAGGDLTGAYPNPRIRPGAVTAIELAPPQTEIQVTYSRYNPGPGGHGGWEDYGPPYGGAAYYRDGQGAVHLSGVSKSSFFTFSPGGPFVQNFCASGGLDSSLSLAVMFVLPRGYRPGAREIFAVDSNGAHGRVDVARDGSVICMSGAGDQYVSLDGISFRAAG